MVVVSTGRHQHHDHGTHHHHLQSSSINPWTTLDPELRYHIQHCPCPCNHMGYGNFLDYHVPPRPRPLPILRQETSFGAPVPQHFYYDYNADSCSCSTSGSEGSAAGGPRSPCGSWCICVVVCVIVATVAAGLSLPFAFTKPPQTLDERLQTVQRLLQTVPLIDGHNDLPWNLRKFLHNKLAQLNLSDIREKEPWSKSRWSQTDIPRLRRGLLGAQFWSAYVPCKAQHLDAVQQTLEQIDVVNRLVELNSNHFVMVHSAAELRRVHQQGRIASLIGVEGGHALGNSLAVLRTFYNLGARYLTITHSCDTPWAWGANAGRSQGLTDFGRSVIKEMNRLGMIVDLSHASADTAKAALNASHAPVIFSHSGAYSLCNSTRNVPDEVLKLVALNGGIVMVNFYTYLVSCNDNASLHDVIKHINHIKAVAGVEHVGIGAGYDGINMTPSGLEDVSRYPHLLAELLLDPGWNEREIALLAGLNFLRVFEKVEQVRDQWKRAKVRPAEDSPPYYSPTCSSVYS